jgi:large subunit ribosomal protein L13
MGDFVVVINVEKLAFTEKKGISKVYYKHSNYPGGLKAVNLKDQNQTHPDRVLRDAVWGMLPHNNLGRQLIKRLKIYAGSEHPHTAQTPEPVA